ncbi:MAG: hypothetical protein WCB27_15385 [Thermoguttaceae bacterium]|jgi:hypothetical protein
MNRWYFLIFVATISALVSAQIAHSQNSQGGSYQQPYQPVVPAPTVASPYGGGYGGCYGGGTTVAGSAMNGMANMMSAAGQRNLANSAAAVNMTQAQKNEIENRQQWTNTYFAMREENRRARAAEQGPPPTQEEIVRIAQQGVPKPLATTQVDAVSGQLFWPSALQQECFAAQRGDVDQLVATKARYGALNYEDQMKLRKTILAMFDQLKQQVTQIPPQDYGTSRTFLNSLLYANTKTIL